jgi:subtilisin family serine protease
MIVTSHREFSVPSARFRNGVDSSGFSVCSKRLHLNRTTWIAASLNRRPNIQPRLPLGQRQASLCVSAAFVCFAAASTVLFSVHQSHAATPHELTGLDVVRAKYGLTGNGQTVVVIDTGIAWDQYALGGGIGPNNRVVGGWDFAENDAIPYDDAPGGTHGTHVAGIVGAANGESDIGVAPGADLVALRVFDDSGGGSFSLVESALKWVHENRNAFQYPITTVNLSLGAAWNSDELPPWATLEEELSQLESDGIFISAAAGNNFVDYAAPGLAYPAASPHVVPAMSVDDNGQLSYFSQRDSRAIAAPGRDINSTVPDFAGNNDSVPDDYATRSGTDRAAPYLAGASVLIRQAMELSGYEDITQQTIYDHMVATADSIYDSATEQNYRRLNLARAIDTLLGISGDFNGDGVVSAADYTVWRNTLGTTTDFRADANYDRAVDEADYVIWKQQFSQKKGSPSSNLGILEPQSCVLSLAALIPVFAIRRPRRGVGIQPFTAPSPQLL